MATKFFVDSERCKDGYVHAPTKPGLGYEIDFDELEKRIIATA